MRVFQAGKYETDEPATWHEGDWTIQTTDSIRLIWLPRTKPARMNQRVSRAGVPEPSSIKIPLVGLLAIECDMLPRRKSGFVEPAIGIATVNSIALTLSLHLEMEAMTARISRTSAVICGGVITRSARVYGSKRTGNFGEYHA